MILTHYFPNLHQDGVISTQELFTLITEYEPQEQQALAMRLLCSPGRALRRFDRFDDYMQRRIQTERWLYSAFLAMGGKPVSRYPFYLILGKNERLKCDFGPGAGELILDTAQINAYDLSFTLGDSIGLYFSSTTKKLYSLEEIESISQNTAFVQKQMAPLEPYHRYIEAQLWDKHYLSAAQIIRYYPCLLNFIITDRKMPELFIKCLIYLISITTCREVSSVKDTRVLGPPQRAQKDSPAKQPVFQGVAHCGRELTYPIRKALQKQNTFRMRERRVCRRFGVPVLIMELWIIRDYHWFQNMSTISRRLLHEPQKNYPIKWTCCIAARNTSGLCSCFMWGKN